MAKVSNEYLPLSILGTFPDDWQIGTLALVCRQVTDGTHDSPKPVAEGGYPLVTGKAIKNRKIDFSVTYNISDLEHQKVIDRSKPERDDILFANIGNSIGDLVRVTTDRPFSIKNVALFKPDQSKIYSRYLEYFLLSEQVQGFIKGSTRGSAQPFIGLSSLRGFPIALPPMDEQRNVGMLLGALDDRICLLRETNATLEAIAQALFKSWFVDFDPVHARQQGIAPQGMDEATAALFPDSFEESELGLVPKGWQVQTLGEVCTVTIGGIWGKDTKEDPDLIPAISLRGVDLENLRSLGFAKDAPVRWVKPAAMEKRRISENEVLVASSGAGPCGRPLWAGTAFESIYGLPVVFSNFVKRLDCGSSEKAIYVDRLLANMRESKEIWNYINGTSIPNLDDKLLLATKKVVIPSEAALLAFEEIARAIYLRRYSEQAQTLASLRDTLLPRLISGQLRLPEAEATA